jgi:hypothetical protein
MDLAQLLERAKLLTDEITVGATASDDAVGAVGAGSPVAVPGAAGDGRNGDLLLTADELTELLRSAEDRIAVLEANSNIASNDASNEASNDAKIDQSASIGNGSSADDDRRGTNDEPNSVNGIVVGVVVALIVVVLLVGLVLYNKKAQPQRPTTIVIDTMAAGSPRQGFDNPVYGQTAARVGADEDLVSSRGGQQKTSGYMDVPIGHHPSPDYMDISSHSEEC